MTEDILEALFDSNIKVKLLRLFLRNPDRGYTLDEVINKIQADPSSTRYQLRKIRRAGVIKTELLRIAPQEEEQKKSAFKKKGRERRLYQANPAFEFYNELRSLVLKSAPGIKLKLREELQKIGRIKLALITGIFLNVENVRIDLLIVSDNIGRLQLAQLLRRVESELGQEIRYTVMGQSEFDYRLDMFDNFVQAVLRGPHEKLIDKTKAMA